MRIFEKIFVSFIFALKNRRKISRIFQIKQFLLFFRKKSILIFSLFFGKVFVIFGVFNGKFGERKVSVELYQKGKNFRHKIGEKNFEKEKNEKEKFKNIFSYPF